MSLLPCISYWTGLLQKLCGLQGSAIRSSKCHLTINAPNRFGGHHPCANLYIVRNATRHQILQILASADWPSVSIKYFIIKSCESFRDYSYVGFSYWSAVLQITLRLSRFGHKVIKILANNRDDKQALPPPGMPKSLVPNSLLAIKLCNSFKRLPRTLHQLQNTVRPAGCSRNIIIKWLTIYTPNKVVRHHACANLD